MKLPRITCCLAVSLLVALAGPSIATAQQMQIRDLCRVKGQEENTLHGLGLVVGLNGTGDSETPTIRALAKMLELMGNPVSQDSGGQWMLDELRNTKNVAMVFVTATIPSEGGRQGDNLSCEVNAVSASSLEGGYLMMTPLLGPRPGSPRIYAFCQGPIALDQRGPTTAGKISGGCRLEADFHNRFFEDGKITLVLDRTHASFNLAYDLEDYLNDPESSGLSDGSDIAKAIDQVNIEVKIPSKYIGHEVEFVSEVLNIRFLPPRPDARVVVDKRNGVIVVGENVMIGRVAVSHNNIAVETGNAPGIGPLVPLTLSDNTATTRLEALVTALNELKVSTDDIISIIENLNASKALYGKLITR